MIYFAQAIRERRTYTDFMIGLIMLTQYYKEHKKIFYIKEDIANIFSNENCLFHNIENNNSYKLLKNIRLKAVKGRRCDPMHRDDTYIKKLFIERITKDTDINDMYIKDITNGSNFLLDNTVKFYYLNHYNDGELHYVNNNKKRKNKSSIKIDNIKTLNNKNLSEKFTESDMNMIKKMINKLTTKEITDILSESTNVRKKEIYNYCLELKNEK